MAFPITAVMLSTRGQLQLGQNPQRHLRLFVIDEEISGIGVEWVRPNRQVSSCSRTNIRYFLWEGNADPISFCQCFDPLDGTSLAAEDSQC